MLNKPLKVLMYLKEMTSTSSKEFFLGGEGPKYHLFKKVTGYPSEGGAE